MCRCFAFTVVRDQWLWLASAAAELALGIQPVMEARVHSVGCGRGVDPPGAWVWPGMW